MKELKSFKNEIGEVVLKKRHIFYCVEFYHCNDNGRIGRAAAKIFRISSKEARNEYEIMKNNMMIEEAKLRNVAYIPDPKVIPLHLFQEIVRSGMRIEH